MSEVELKPWTVVVIGKWNPSILTPWNIGKRLLNTPDGEPLQVEVPMNVAGSPRVRRNGIVVSVDENHLVIEVERGKYEALSYALAAAREAVTWLKDTPLQAVGINITFALSDVTMHFPLGTNEKWDAALEHTGYEIVRHIAGRAVKWDDARILVVADRAEDGSGTALVNFERKSGSVEAILEFLRRPVDTFRQHVEAMVVHLRTGGNS